LTAELKFEVLDAGVLRVEVSELAQLLLQGVAATADADADIGRGGELHFGDAGLRASRAGADRSQPG
jgi:hypothetical protein